MLLLVSDLHLGRGTAAQSRAAERDAVALLRAHEGRVLDGGTLVLAGDVFHEYVEYRHLVPKTAARLVGLLAEWADRGADVLYLVGNRDPWHIDFFGTEIGVRVLSGPATLEVGGQTVFVAHGDAYQRRTGPRAERLLRSPWLARLYRNALPGDGAFALARWVSRTFGTDGAADPGVARDLRDAARGLLTGPADVVVFGHSHQEALEETPDGTYINLGYWFGARTFARIDADGPALLRWSDGAAHPARPGPVALPL